MKKKSIFFALATMIIALSFFHFNTNNINEADSAINQLGGVAIYAGFKSEYAADRAMGRASGSILIGTGMGLIQAGVPASVTPAGWISIAAGLII
ncbi:MAG: hypothetical protein LBR13_01405 [Dysgonamonadaceae bacterium]|nr:hypothetical protein [Dysgonamonadaceae bacterium]